jgi:hypothetical protein
MKPITIATSLRSSASEFTFEDLFPSSPVEGDWSTPDAASIRMDACTEEDIGGELEYDEEDIEEEQGGKRSATTVNNGEDSPTLPAEPIKMSRNIGPQSFSTLAMVGKGGFGKV